MKVRKRFSHHTTMSSIVSLMSNRVPQIEQKFIVFEELTFYQKCSIKCIGEYF